MYQLMRSVDDSSTVLRWQGCKGAKGQASTHELRFCFRLHTPYHIRQGVNLLRMVRNVGTMQGQCKVKLLRNFAAGVNYCDYWGLDSQNNLLSLWRILTGGETKTLSMVGTQQLFHE